MTRVRCPKCNKILEWSADSPWKPFCSERCQLIDLGAWFKEEQCIPGERSLADPMSDTSEDN